MGDRLRPPRTECVRRLSHRTTWQVLLARSAVQTTSAQRALRATFRRLDKSRLDGGAVAARNDALLVVGLDPRVNEDRPFSRVQQLAHRSGAADLRHPFDAAEPAGLRRAGEIDAGGSVARLHA